MRVIASVAVVTFTAVVASQALVAQDQAATRHRAGCEALRLTDPARSRPIQLDVWYPTNGDEATHRYGLSSGRVAVAAPVAAGRFPVVLLSHGALGSASNYSWIAERLARAGFVVAGVSHFGESRRLWRGHWQRSACRKRGAPTGAAAIAAARPHRR